VAEGGTKLEKVRESSRREGGSVSGKGRFSGDRRGKTGVSAEERKLEPQDQKKKEERSHAGKENFS